MNGVVVLDRASGLSEIRRADHRVNLDHFWGVVGDELPEIQDEDAVTVTHDEADVVLN
jgi:hypothetical protein